MKGKWTQEEILEAMEKMKERFLQNADYLFCNPADYEELNNLIGDRLNVRSAEGIEKGRIYLVDREFIEQYRPGLIEQETEDEA